jgi:hypothetical protein
MTEEEKMVFWGDLVEPIVSLLGGLTVRGEFKLAAVVQDIVNKAENTALEEREACAKVCENIYEGDEGCGDWPTPEMCAAAIRARGQG